MSGPQGTGDHVFQGPCEQTPPGQQMSGDEIVISGVSGLYPNSDSTAQFAENLFNKVDMITVTDFNFQHPEAPKHLGKINGISKFDAQFFRIAYNNAFNMEPMNKKLLEQAYMAMYDSGINPLFYKGRRVGVFVGSSYSDSCNAMMYNTAWKGKGNGLSGSAKAMFANRFSFWLDGKSPSVVVDCASGSSMFCLAQAYSAMRSGLCDAAVIGGSNLCLEPHLGLNLRKAGFVSLEGKTKCFDKNGDGYVRAEAVNCIFLQKAKEAKRIYAEVCFVEAGYGLKEGLSFSSMRPATDIEEFLKMSYSRIGLSPKDVEYVEAEGTAVAEADINELEAIAKVFGTDRPIKVGCVKSNMGHSGPASGVCALTKMIIAYHKGKLPANLHYTEPLNTPAVENGKIEVLQETTAFNRGYTAVNDFAFNGTNCHVLLKGHFKPKDSSKYLCKIPRLIPISARKEEGIKKIVDILKKQPFDPELIGMLQNIYKIETPGNTCRGFTIVDTVNNNETVSLAESFELYSGANRPLWLVYSGMGSQWPAMARDLMNIPVFAKAIHKCHKALEPKGIDLIKILTESDKTTFDNIVNCFIGISAVQIGLTDVLKAVGLVPDYVIGHSLGEMGCAYFDNCFTAEDMILGSYCRGIISIETKFIKGAMVAVGLGYKDILPLLPDGIDVACHNSKESSTLSGPYEELLSFVTDLTAKGIFAREVPCTNIPYHSRYIAHAGPEFLRQMGEIIKEPVARSEKWISTSVPQDKWHEPLAKFSSPEYHAYNMLNSVLFEEAAQLIPENAVLVEVAPHGLLQAILKRSHPNCVYIPLTKRGVPNQAQFFLEALGKIYQEGYNLNVEALYPAIEYPVATETPMISHYVEWEHSETWPAVHAFYQDEKKAACRNVVISIYDDEYQYLTGYVRNGKNVFPESAILKLVWETFGMSMNVNHEAMSIIFKDIQFHGEAIINSKESIKLTIIISKGNNNFEVSCNGALLTTGFIVRVNKIISENMPEKENERCKTDFNAGDIYKCLHSKGLTLSGDLQSIHQINENKTEAAVKWNGNWVTFLDSLLQLCVLARDADCISKPIIIKKITINVEEHYKVRTYLKMNEDTYFRASLDNQCKIVRSGGAEIRDVIFYNISNQEQQPDVLDALIFTPHTIIDGNVNIETAVLINLQLVADNIASEDINITEIVNGSDKGLRDIIRRAADFVPRLKVHIQSTEKINEINFSTSNLVVIQTFLNSMVIDDLLSRVNENTFILAYNDKNVTSLSTNDHFCILSSMTAEGKDVKLLRRVNSEVNDTTVIPICDKGQFLWVSKLRKELEKAKHVVLVSKKQPQCGIFGLVKELRKKYKNNISLVIDNDSTAMFDNTRPGYKKQLSKKLAFNVLQKILVTCHIKSSGRNLSPIENVDGLTSLEKMKKEAAETSTSSTSKTKGQWGSYYYVPILNSSNIQDFKLINCTLGDNESLKWIETPTLRPSTNTVKVFFSGLSQRDAQKVAGLTEEQKNEFGMDFSGLDSKGERVMGLIPGGALASMVIADPDLLWPVPEHWSLEEASTVPLPYVCAYYCLVIRGQILKKHSVFVNGGAGAIGQAVISLCLSLNCQVFTSVSTLEKKQFLLKLFPRLNANNIGCSQNGDSYDMVAVNTKGRRCNFVINCASDVSREAAMKCLGPFGIFFDVNTDDLRRNKLLGMAFYDDDKSYYAVNLASIFRPENIKEKKMLQMIISEGIISGAVQPLSRVVYHATDITRAFRLLSENRNKGRVLIQIKNTEISAPDFNVIPKLSYSANGSYIIVCDDSELGTELANRLVKRGVKKIMLKVKTKVISGYLRMKIKAWVDQGADIKISTENLNTTRNCLQLLQDAGKMGKVLAIFIIHELYGKDSWSQDDFLAKYSNNMSLVAALDTLSRNNCPELGAFAIISRASSNEVDEFATSAFDKICQERFALGLPATSFRIESLQEFQIANKSTPEVRLWPQNYETVLNALETSLKQKQTSCVTTYNLREMQSSQFHEKVLKILGIPNDQINQNLLISKLIVNDVPIEELRILIRKYLKLEFSREQLRNMSISSILALKNTEQSDETENTSTKIARGLAAFYTSVDHDIYKATEAMIPMQTLCSTIRMDELDGCAAHLMLIPGFDGQHDVFKPMCERLKIPAITFQLGPDVVTKTVPEMASLIMKNIKKTFTFKSKFYLLGYSFGVVVALEVAALLEKEGHRGIVYCLDSSPDALKTQLDTYLAAETVGELQNLILNYMSRLITQDQHFDLNELDLLTKWSEKVDLCIMSIKKSVNYSSQYLRDVLESAYQRVCAAKEHEPELKLESELILIKSKSYSDFPTLDADYGLSKYCNKPVKVFEIASDHASVCTDCRIPNIVNKLLEPRILEEFRSLNLCESYLLDR